MKKALLGPLVMLVFMIGTGVFALSNLSSLERRMSYVAENLMPATGAATDLMRALYEERLAAEGFVANSTVETRQVWEARHRETVEAIERAQAAFADSARANQLQQPVAMHGVYTQAFSQRIAPSRLEVLKLRSEVMDPVSVSVGDLVTDVMESAYSVSATRIGELAASIVNELMRTRVDVEHFMRTADGEMDARDRTTSVKQLLGTLNSAIGPMDHDYMLERFAQQASAKVREAIQEWEKYEEALDRAIDLTYTAHDSVQSSLYIQGRLMTASARGMQSLIFEELGELGAATSRETQQALWLLVAVIAFAGIAGMAIGYIVTRGVVKPLLVTNREIDQMLRDMDAGRGDLTRRLAVGSGDEVGQLANNFNRFVETLQKVVRNIGNETNQLASAAEELSAVTNQTSAGVQRQNAETDQVATAMTQMTATVQEIARNAVAASQAASDASDTASEGRRTVDATVNAIERLVQLLESGGGSVDRLSQDVEAITSIIDVIREVAEQTNLLALNAAIEAARAGDQGRGFAVVADEVRNLAQKTQSSTHKIQELIETLQNGAQTAVSAMNEGRTQGQRTVEHAAEAGSALERIDRKVQVIRDMNAQIASAAEEQTAVSNDISQSVVRIRDVAMETAGGAEQTASSSEELARLGERLKKMMSQFRV